MQRHSLHSIYTEWPMPEKIPAAMGPPRRPQRAPKIALIQPLEVPHETNFIWILRPTEHRMVHARKNTRCKRPARRAPNVAQNPIIRSIDLQTCRSCHLKPSQHAEGYYTEYRMATDRNFSLLQAHHKTKMGPRPKTGFGHTLEERREPFYVENLISPTAQNGKRKKKEPAAKGPPEGHQMWPQGP